MFADFCKNSPKLAGTALIACGVIFTGGVTFAVVYNAIKGGSLSLSNNGLMLSGFNSNVIETTNTKVEKIEG